MELYQIDRPTDYMGLVLARDQGIANFHVNMGGIQD